MPQFWANKTTVKPYFLSENMGKLQLASFKVGFNVATTATSTESKNLYC
jgi:hypothetical protein